MRLGAALGFACAIVTGAVAQDLTPTQRLGQQLFFDTRLSLNGDQACASCHDPRAGFSSADPKANAGGGVIEGSVKGRFGNRKPPSAAYATFAPKLRPLTPSIPYFTGGNFWDGRATGEKLGSPTADQAQGPFLNPLEQALPDGKAVVDLVCSGPSGALFKEVWGAEACADPAKGYDSVALSLAAFEASSAVNQFSSKYDAYLSGTAQLTPEEAQGLALFEGKGTCNHCHPSRPGPKGELPLFTTHAFENVGTPPNPANPFYANAEANPKGAAWVDDGLGAYLATTAKYAKHAADNMGKHRIPTLRNVDLRPSPDAVKAYGHNGYFKSLEQIVRFYNTRDTLPACGDDGKGAGETCWPAPETAANVNRVQMGKLGLTAEEERALVAFLKTLSDGFTKKSSPTAAQ